MFHFCFHNPRHDHVSGAKATSGRPNKMIVSVHEINTVEEFTKLGNIEVCTCIQGLENRCLATFVHQMHLHHQRDLLSMLAGLREWRFANTLMFSS